MALSIQEAIAELSTKLESADNLNAEGVAMRDAIRDGSLTGPQIGLIIQGATFSSGDEILGAVRSVTNRKMMENISSRLNQATGSQFSPRDVATELERAPMRQFREENPAQALALEMGGGLVYGPVGAGRAGLTRMAITGGASSGVSGAMASEGDLEDRFFSGLASATVGAVASPAIAKAGDAFLRLIRGAGAQGGKQLDRQGKQQAIDIIVEAIQADGKTPSEALVDLANQAGKGTTLADVGSNTQALIDAVSILPGPGKATATNYLRNRQEGRYSRLGTIMQEAFGQRANFFNDFQALKAARGKSANTLYGKAFKESVSVTPELQELLQTPALRDAFRTGMQIAGNMKMPTKFRIGTDGRIISEDGSTVDAVDGQFMHILKMGLDDVAFPKMPKQGIGATQISAVRDVRNEFLELLDDAIPDYRRARDVYSTDSRMISAMEQGRNLNATRDLDELEDQLRKMSKSERESFSLGALQAIEDQAARGTQAANTAYNLYKTPRRRRLLRFAFPSGADGDRRFQQFMANLEQESRMAVTERAALGSQTAQRQEFVRQLRDVATPDTITLDPGSMVLAMLRDEGLQASDRQLQAASSEIARVLTETDPQALAKIRRDLGDMTFLQSVTKNAPSVASDIGRLLVNFSTRPLVTGGEIGRLTERQLNPNQTRLMQ